MRFDSTRLTAYAGGATTDDDSRAADSAAAATVVIGDSSDLRAGEAK